MLSSFHIASFPIRIYIAKQEIRTMIYLDDGICAGGTREEAMANRLFMVDTLQKSGQLG